MGLPVCCRSEQLARRPSACRCVLGRASRRQDSRQPLRLECGGSERWLGSGPALLLLHAGCGDGCRRCQWRGGGGTSEAETAAGERRAQGAQGGAGGGDAGGAQIGLREATRRDAACQPAEAGGAWAVSGAERVWSRVSVVGLRSAWCCDCPSGHSCGRVGGWGTAAPSARHLHPARSLGRTAGAVGAKQFRRPSV